MNQHQRTRLEWKTQTAILSNLAETYIAKKMNEGFFDLTLGKYDVMLTSTLKPTQNGFTSFFEAADLLFYPKKIEDFLWMSEFIHWGVAINISAIQLANYEPTSLNETQLKQWEFIKKHVNHVLVNFLVDTILSDIEKVILKTQHKFGVFDDFELIRTGNYPSEMNTAEVMGQVTSELIKHFEQIV